MAKIKIVVVGSKGKMGSAAVETFNNNPDKFELVGTCASKSDDLGALIDLQKPDVMVELTGPDSVYANSKVALEKGVKTVVGATGLSDDQITELEDLAKGTGAIIAPNFAIGAILMMQFSKKATEYFNKYEIIEMHHDQKKDAPSGTAIKTAEMMKAAANNSDEVPIHSVRLPGLVAHQEVIFGSQGQTLTIRHDTIDRSSFMPGILFSCEQVMKLDKMVYGLDNLI